MLELAVLGLLKEQPLHGYELKKRLAETLGSFWGVSFGSLYPALRRLERSGAIEVVTTVEGTLGNRAPNAAPAAPATGSLSGEAAAARLRVVAPPSGRRNRKAYRITAVGEAQFHDLLVADDTGDDERLFSLKLAFCRHLDPPDRLALLERRRADLADRLSRASRTRGGPALDRYVRSLVEHRATSTQRDLEWVDELIRTERAALDAPQEGATA